MRGRLGRSMSKKKVTLIYVPIHLGGTHRGASMGPLAIQVAELSERIAACGFSVHSEVSIAVPNSLCWWDRKVNTPKCVPEILSVSNQLSQAVEAALDQGTIPITIGGDHSLAIGSIAGVSNYQRKRKESFGLVWFDAHGDINTPDTSYSGNVHGMPLAVSLGLGDRRLVELNGHFPKVEAARTALIGIRDVDPPETEIIRQTGITAFTMHDVDRLGIASVTEESLAKAGNGAAHIHLSFDLDVLDPEIAPGVSTVAPGGLNYREVSFALSHLAASGKVGSIDIAELNPANDLRNRTAHLATDLVLYCLGKQLL